MTFEQGLIKDSQQQITPEDLQKIFGALQTLAVAVSALPGSELNLGIPETGQTVSMKLQPETGLTIRYKPVAEEITYDGEPLLTAPPEEPPLLVQPSSIQESGQPETENQRVFLYGRLGRDPWFVTTKSGTLIGRFPLAVPDANNDKGVQWHNIVAFKKTASSLQELGLKKGQEAKVVGYEHTDKPKSGKGKGEKQIYAVVIKPGKK